MSVAERTDRTVTQPSAQDIEHVRAKVRASGSSFYWAMRILPEDRRNAIFAVYAFCREVDDIADGDTPTANPKRALDAWRHELDRLYQGRPGTPVSRALATAVASYGLDKKDLLAIIDGMEMDASGPIKGPSMAELELYCDRVACAVGRLCVPIFGEPGKAGIQTADALGLALQLTNILRDIEEDAAMDRLYLPAELLDAEGITSRVPADVLRHPQLNHVCRALAKRAERAFADADAAIARCDRAAMRPAIIMMKVYRHNLDKLIAEDWANLPRQARETSWSRKRGKLVKLAIALYYGLIAR